jgi:hypothetical protein
MNSNPLTDTVLIFLNSRFEFILQMIAALIGHADMENE